MGRGFPLMVVASAANIAICQAMAPFGFQGWVVCLMVSIFLLIGYFIGEYNMVGEIVGIRLARMGIKRRSVVRERVGDTIDFFRLLPAAFLAFCEMRSEGVREFHKRGIPTDRMIH